MSADGSATPPSADRPLRVAVVGAGPAGIYAADALTRQDDVPVAVDLIDRLPTPFGLVRHGIAPDHPKMRAIRDTLHRTPRPPAGPLRRQRRDRRGHLAGGAAPARRRRHLHLRRRRSTATSASRARTCPAASPPPTWSPGTPGTPTPTAPGSRRRWPASGRSSSSASATSRWTSPGCWPAPPAELEPTDMPQHVLDALAATPVEEVTVLGRRGPAQATFTTQELRELGELERRDRAGRRRRPRARPGQPRSAPPPTGNVARNLAVLRGWADHVRRARPHPAAAALLRAGPVRLLGEDRVTGVEVERTAVDADGRAVGTGELDVLPADLVVRSVGYFGHAAARAAGRRARRARCRTTAGRVLRDGTPVARRVRGRLDQARARAASSAPTSTTPGRPSPRCWPTPPTACSPPRGPVGDLVEELVARGAEPVLLDDWRAIDAAEVALGATPRPGPDDAARARGAAGRRPGRRGAAGRLRCGAGPSSWRSATRGACWHGSSGSCRRPDSPSGVLPGSRSRAAGRCGRGCCRTGAAPGWAATGRPGPAGPAAGSRSRRPGARGSRGGPAAPARRG